jgi:hypothetical protein
MTFGLFGEFFVFICFLLSAMSSVVEDDIRSKIIKHLGMKNLPDIKHVSTAICLGKPSIPGQIWKFFR